MIGVLLLAVIRSCQMSAPHPGAVFGQGESTILMVASDVAEIAHGCVLPLLMGSHARVRRLTEDNLVRSCLYVSSTHGNFKVSKMQCLF